MKHEWVELTELKAIMGDAAVAMVWGGIKSRRVVQVRVSKAGGKLYLCARVPLTKAMARSAAPTGGSA